MIGNDAGGRKKLSHHEQMLDAQAGCIPCKLCGGSAVITDAGIGAGYYVACGNSVSFHASKGCLINQRRLGGWAYNVMDWWNRLHAPASAGVLVEAVEARDTAQSAVEAWAEVCESLEAHLQDRVAMQDEANPAAYLSILRSSMADVHRASVQIRAARWADYNRQSAEIDRLRQALSTTATPASDGVTASEVDKEPLTLAQLGAVIDALDFCLAGDWDAASHDHAPSVYRRALEKLTALNSRIVRAASPKVASKPFAANDPTPEMIEAGRVAAIRSANTRASSNPARFATDIYGAMVAVAPDRFGEGYQAGVEASARVAEAGAAYARVTGIAVDNEEKGNSVGRIIDGLVRDIRALHPATGDEA